MAVFLSFSFRYLFWYSHNGSQTWLSFPSFFSLVLFRIFWTHTVVNWCLCVRHTLVASSWVKMELRTSMRTWWWEFSLLTTPPLFGNGYEHIIYQQFFTGCLYIVFKYVILTHILQRNWRVLNKVALNHFHNKFLWCFGCKMNLFCPPGETSPHSWRSIIALSCQGQQEDSTTRGVCPYFTFRKTIWYEW